MKRYGFVFYIIINIVHKNILMYMDKDNKRAQRRKDEQTIWMRRLNREFNNEKQYFDKNYVKNSLEKPKVASIPTDLKNSKYGI